MLSTVSSQARSGSSILAEGRDSPEVIAEEEQPNEGEEPTTIESAIIEEEKIRLENFSFLAI